METVLTACRKVVYWAILCVVIGFAVTPAAQAQFLGFGGFFGALCGTPNTPPVPAHIAESGGLRIFVATMNTTVLTEMEDGLRKLRHQLILVAKDPTGKVVWRRVLILKSRGIATVIPGFPGYQFGEFFTVTSTVSPFFVFNSECLGISVNMSGGQRYVVVALGTQAAKGNPAAGEDKTMVNIWVLNRNNGTIVRTFRPRPQAGRYFLPFMSGIYDIDNDGNDELVLFFAKFVGTNRYDAVFQYYNLTSGVLKNTIRTNQFNRFTVE